MAAQAARWQVTGRALRPARASVGQPQRQGDQKQREDQRRHDGQAQACRAVVQLRPRCLAGRASSLDYRSSALRANEVFAAHVGPFQPVPDRSLRRCWTFQASFPPRLSPGQTGQPDHAGKARKGASSVAAQPEVFVSGL